MSQLQPRKALLRVLPWVYGASAARFFTPIVLLPVMAVRLGPVEFGRLSFIAVWAALLSIIVEGGFLAAATRVAVSAEPARRWQLAQQVFTARSVLCIPTVLLAALAAWWSQKQPANGPAAHQWLDALATTGLAIALGWPATWYLQATQQLNRWAKVEIAVQAASILLCLAFAHSVEIFVLMQAVTAGVLAVWGWRWLYRDLRGEAGAEGLWVRGQIVPGLRVGWTMMPVSIAGAAYSLALPAIGSRQMSSVDLGHYFLVDRLVRALVSAIDPVIAVIYPKIVRAFSDGEAAALRYAARWAVLGGVLGLCILGAGVMAWPLVQSHLSARSGGMDVDRLHSIFMVLGWLLPLLMGWKFLGYWMLASGRYDRAYRSCVVIGGGIGLLGALIAGGAAGALGLAWTAVVAEIAVVFAAITGVWLTRRNSSNSL